MERETLGTIFAIIIVGFMVFAMVSANKELEKRCVSSGGFVIKNATNTGSQCVTQKPDLWGKQ